MMNLAELGSKNSANSYTIAVTESSHWQKPTQYQSMRNVCIFISLQSFLMHIFNQATSTHWSQLQSPNRLTHLTFSVLITSLHSSALTHTNRVLLQANRKRPPVFAAPPTHIHTNMFKEPSAHSFTPTRSGWKAVCGLPGSLECCRIDVQHKVNKREAQTGWLYKTSRFHANLGFVEIK